MIFLLYLGLVFCLKTFLFNHYTPYILIFSQFCVHAKIFPAESYIIFEHSKEFKKYFFHFNMASGKCNLKFKYYLN